ncbi:MAG: cupredoxin domain-containing protein [Dehalococcoidia bacterium]
MHLVAAVATVGVVVGGLAAACGGGDDGSSAGGVAQGVAGVPDGSPFVDQRDLRFKPDKLTAKAGTAIYFKNSESALHTVTINKVNESGNMKRNEVFIWTPPSAGSYAVTCDLHPQMKATITVE